ncbi:LysE family translocator [Amphritea sp. HPY]|uniref:LysE family translocator n=1 Tax=Amphritea sp. HPY TaxID=3421652 RepID=UPI003D7DD9CF
MAEWLIFAGIMLAGALVPGANTAIILRNTLQGSRRAGFITALGLAFALSIHVILSIVGLAALISENPTLYTAIRWLGSAYLVYMGLTYILTKPFQSGTEEGNSGHGSPFIAGMMVSLFNPKVLIMFIAIFSHVMQEIDSWGIKTLYAITPVIIEFSWLSIIVLLLSQSGVQRKLNQIKQSLERVIGAGMVLLGIKLGLG